MSTFMSAAVVDRPRTTRGARSGVADRSIRPSVSALTFETVREECPFQAYGKLVRKVQVLRPDSIESMAAWWATHSGFPNPNSALTVALKIAPSWFDEFSIVSAYDRSLMLPGHQNLVMHVVDNPCQIPDQPPRSVLERMLMAEQRYPQANIYYAEPVFAVGNDPSALPAPMTEDAFLREAGARILIAQKMALQWGWLYRGQDLLRKTFFALERWQKERELARHQKRVRQLEEIARKAEEDQALHGRVTIPRIPLREAEELIRFEERYEAFRALHPEIDTMTHKAMTPVRVILRRFDPLLFLELPNESGKLRLIGHWFWQQTSEGKRRLYLHLED